MIDSWVLLIGEALNIYKTMRYTPIQVGYVHFQPSYVHVRFSYVQFQRGCVSAWLGYVSGNLGNWRVWLSYVNLGLVTSVDNHEQSEFELELYCHGYVCG